MHVAIAGNIGAGKTTLTGMLAKHYRWEPHFEDVLKNPYLDDFYERMERWSFNLQIYFLNSRFNQMINCSNNNKDTIQEVNAQFNYRFWYSEYTNSKPDTFLGGILNKFGKKIGSKITSKLEDMVF